MELFLCTSSKMNLDKAINKHVPFTKLVTPYKKVIPILPLSITGHFCISKNTIACHTSGIAFLNVFSSRSEILLSNNWTLVAETGKQMAQPRVEVSLKILRQMSHC